MARKVHFKKEARSFEPPPPADTVQRPPSPSRQRTRSDEIDDRTHQGSLQPPSLALIQVRQPECEAATNYFLSTYADGCYLDYVPALFRTVGGPSLLGSSLEAVALACLSNQMSRPDLNILAAKKHSAALRNASKAIQSQETMTNDETLASVMLLAFYSSLSPNPTEASSIWTNHIRGALALATTQPADRLQSATSQSLIYHIISCVQIDCIQRQERIPSQLKRLYCIPLDVPNFQLEFWYLVDELADLGAAVGQSSRLHDTEVVRRACRLDEVASKLEKTMRPDYAYQNIPTFGDSTSSGQAQHVYTNHRVAQAWNTLRMCRLRLNEMIFSHAAEKSMLSENLLQDTGMAKAMSAALLNAMGIVCEIHASVPPFLRQHDPEARVNANPVAWAQSLMWPLCMAGGSPLVSETFRLNIIEQIRTIGKAARLPQAALAANRLCHNCLDQDWYVLMHSSGRPVCSLDDRTHVLYLC